jgi:hypothetical protein
MKLLLFDVKELQAGVQYILQSGDVGLGIHLKKDDQTISADAGFPENRIISSKGIVTFGLSRLLKQEERNSVTSVASQVYEFIVQNPKWTANTVYRPVYEVSVDDALALALLDKADREKLLISGTKLQALLAELNEWSANKFNFVKSPYPKLLNYFLNIHSYPFYDLQGKSKIDLCELSLMDLKDLIVNSFEEAEPVFRTFPSDLKFDIENIDELTALIIIKSNRLSADEIAAQHTFQMNPALARVITMRKLKNSTKNFVSIYNSSLYKDNLEAYNYVDTKELNTQEHKIGGAMEWKNLRLTILGPRKGTSLTSEIIWKYARVLFDNPSE